MKVTRKASIQSFIRLLAAASFVFVSGQTLADHGGGSHVNLNLTVPATSTGDYTATWNSVGNVVLQEKLNGGGYTTAYYGSASSFAFTNKPDGTYTYRIAWLFCVWGCQTLYTLPETVVVSTLPVPPAITQLISLDGSFDVSWFATPGVTTFKLEEQVGAGSWTQIYSGSATSTSLSGRATDSYNYRVIECTGGDCSDPSEPSPMEVEIVSTLWAEPGIASPTTAGGTAFSASVDRRGDASIVIPLRTPNGVNGLSSRLALTYSSGAATDLTQMNKSEGALGYGWSLRGPAEVRRCRVGIGGEIEYDSTDQLCLGGNALFLVAGSGYWADDAEYRTKIDTQVKIVAHGTGLPNRYFEVFTPDGGTILLGDTAETRLISPAKTDPYAWSPRLHTDAFGNEMSYDWQTISAIGTNYLANIYYANARIELRYDERCQSATNCDSQSVQNGENVLGIKSRAVVLNRIATYIGGQLADDYRLDSNYVDGYLRIEQIQHCARNNSGSAWDCMTPLVFNWDKLTILETGEPPSEQLVVDEITNSYGDKTNFEYLVIDGSGATSHPLHVDAHAEFDQNPYTVPDVAYSTRQLAVVKHLKRPDGNGSQTTTLFNYQDYPLYSTTGYGYVGFYSVYSELYNNKMYVGTSETHYDGHIREYRQYRLDFPFIGRLARSIIDVDTDPSSGKTWTRTTKHMWGWEDAATAGVNVKKPYLDSEYDISNELRADQSTGYGYASKTYYDLCYRDLDASGNCETSGTLHEHPTQLVAYTAHGLNVDATASHPQMWGRIQPAIVVGGVINATQQVYDYSNIPANWLIGFVEHTKTSWGSPLSESIETDFARDDTYHNKPGVIHQFPGDAVYDNTTTMTYDGYGNTTSVNRTGVDMPSIYSSASSFLNNMYPQTVTNPKSQSASLDYDERFGSVDSVNDPNSQTSTVTFDPFGRAILATASDGSTVSTTYASCSSGCSAVTWATPRLKVKTEYDNGGTQLAPDSISYFDSSGNLVLTETEAFSASDGMVRVEYHYDAIGKLIKRSLPYFSTGSPSGHVESFYDHKGRVVHASRPDGSNISTTIYADVGTGGFVNVEVEETGTGDTKKSRFNVLGQLEDTIDAYGTSGAVTTEYTYTVHGLLHTVKVDNVQVADINYDAGLNRDSIIEPNSGTTTFDYYSNSWVKQIEDANSNKTKYTYDALGRVITKIDGFGGAGVVTNSWTWDTATNGVGLLASRNNGSEFSETYTYDLKSRLDTITAAVNVSGFNDNGNYVISYDYDGAGRLESINYPNSISLDNVYLATGYMSKVKKGATDLHEYTDVDAFGNIKNEKYGNGLKTAYDYDANTGRLTSIETGTTGVPTSVQDLMYTWRTNGTLLTRTNERGAASDITEIFGYDDLNRLESADTNTSGRTLTQDYDDHGNILFKQSDIAGDMDVTSYSYPTSTNPHRLASANIDGISNIFTYDSAGNITLYNAASGDDTYIDYDKASHVTKITVGDSSSDPTPTARDEFWHGPDGQRFLRKASWMDGSTLEVSWTLYMLGGTFEEVHPDHDSAVNYTQRILVTDKVQHQYIKYPSSSTTVIDYVHRDHLGNIVARSNESGSVVSSVDFDPFGRQRGTLWDRDASASEISDLADGEDSFSARGYTDHEMLNRTGFIHMNGRVFDPRLGRFIQPDPIVGSPTASQNYNRYAYVFNNPLSFTDPSGFDCSNEETNCSSPISTDGTSESARGRGWETIAGSSSGPSSGNSGDSRTVSVNGIETTVNEIIAELSSRGTDVYATENGYVVADTWGGDEISVFGSSRPTESVFDFNNTVLGIESASVSEIDGVVFEHSIDEIIVVGKKVFAEDPAVRRNQLSALWWSGGNSRYGGFKLNGHDDAYRARNAVVAMLAIPAAGAAGAYALAGPTAQAIAVSIAQQKYVLIWNFGRILPSGSQHVVGANTIFTNHAVGGQTVDLLFLRIVIPAATTHLVTE